MQRPTQRKAAVAAETKLAAMAVPEVFAHTFPAPATPPRVTAPKKRSKVAHLTTLAQVAILDADRPRVKTKLAQVAIPDADRPRVKEQPRPRVKKQPRLKRVKQQPRL
jgi:hypothetical protein